MSTSEMRGGEWGGVRVLLSPAAEQLRQALVQPTRTALARNDGPQEPSLRPVLDDDGLLRFRGLWVAVPEAQLSLVDLLVARFQSTVSDAELAGAYGTEPGSRSLIGALNRLGRRVRRLRSRAPPRADTAGTSSIASRLSI